nr:PREDICTED: integrin beta-7 [Lepisosteus oculatus]
MNLIDGEPHSFTVNFKRAEGYPIDLYYLMDLSYSMKDDLENIKKLGQEILSTLQKVTNSVRIGFGCFVDKVAMPYVSTVKSKLRNPCPTRMDTCQPAFSFRNVLPLTDNAKEFEKKVSTQNISGNLDPPEAGLDALMQAAVCQEQIGWKNVTRILVYTSDDTFHTAGDGKLAGIYFPNDGLCHLNSEGLYEKSTEYDYPSVGHLSQVLAANNIQLIFAVNDKSVPIYKALHKLIPQSVVGELKDDSSNVVQLISDAYNNLSSTIYLEHQQLPQGLDITYDSHCGDGSTARGQRRAECTNIKINQAINFTVTVNSTACLDQPQTFVIKPQGINEELYVTVETLCHCDCKDHQPACRATNTSAPCSGRGDCMCGLCMCHGNSLHGQYCQCDDASCDRHNNKICGGNGQCECGKCRCNPGFDGTACECSTATDACGGGSGELCSGNGVCECNRCRCKEGYYGQLCTGCHNCKDDCEKFNECVTCKAKGTENCNSDCMGVQVKIVEEVKEFSCRVGSYVFRIERDSSTGLPAVIYFSDAPTTIDKTYVIVGSAVSGIILIGLAIIILYRISVEVYDRREYQNFLKEQQNVRWKETHNPLFKDATTTVVNPMFQDT